MEIYATKSNINGYLDQKPDNAWSRLDMAIDEVFIQFNALAGELAPVLGPDRQQPGLATDKPAEYSQLGGRASYFANRVSDLTEAIRILRDRIDHAVVA